MGHNVYNKQPHQYKPVDMAFYLNTSFCNSIHTNGDQLVAIPSESVIAALQPSRMQEHYGRPTPTTISLARPAYRCSK